MAHRNQVTCVVVEHEPQTVAQLTALKDTGSVVEGSSAYCSNGNAGSPCMAFFDGTNWKKANAPADNIVAS